MNFPERFANLPEYAFPRLRALLDKHAPGGDVVHMSIGEPKHKFPEFVKTALIEAVEGFNSYPNNNGHDALLDAISAWVKRRYGVTLSPNENLMALNGTREGLFNAFLALCPEKKNGARPKVLIPNPFYQVYAVGASAAGAEPIYLNATAENGFLPNFDAVPANVLDETAAIIMCSPTNPQGAVANGSYWKNLINLAQKHDIRIFADECYSEIYRDEKPTGALEAAQEIGADPETVLAFHSLSKRSNLPGLRSGFVASGKNNISALKQLRAYAGAPLPTALQNVATQVWADETHVVENRILYQQKFESADQIFGDVKGYIGPEAGFFLWLPVVNGEDAALKIWQKTGVRVLPGEYLSRDTLNGNPGKGYIRAAMVAPFEEVKSGLERIRECLY